jgi:glycerate kinase
MPTVVCCPDKFRGTLSAAEAATALAAGVRRAGLDAVEVPLADGGEGTLDVLCPLATQRRWARVRGPLGDEVEAEWGLRADGTAVVEMAKASGLTLVGERREPLATTTYGTGQLIRAALDAGSIRVIVGVGGSATVDGGRGAIEALGHDLHGADVIVACDVQTTFVDAARIFGPQKGARPQDVRVLELRLHDLARLYRDEHGVNVAELPGGGAAGGLAGGLAALGARLVPGAVLVADVAGLETAIAGAAAVLTGEGKLDVTSLEGKVVAHVLERAAAHRVAAGIVAGEIDRDAAPAGTPALSLVELGGSVESAMAHAAELVAQAAEKLAAMLAGR